MWMSLFIFWCVAGAMLPLVIMAYAATDFTLGQLVALGIMAGPISWTVALVLLCLYLIYVIISKTVDTLYIKLVGGKE